MIPAESDKSTQEREYALEMLDVIRRQLHQIRYHKLYFARVARDNGATYREIGEAFGVTEAAVRKMLKHDIDQAVA